MGVNLGPHPDATDDYVEGWKAGKGIIGQAGVEPCQFMEVPSKGNGVMESTVFLIVVARLLWYHFFGT